MTDTHRLTLEDLLFALAFILALSLRLFHLGTLPLSDGEATWALQAFGVAQGSHPLIGAQPGYVMLTAFSFFVFSASNFAARFWPALMGSLLVITPFFFRDRLGSFAALILSFALAIEPGLVAISRTAGSSMIAVSAMMLTWAMWRAGRREWAGVFAGLALLAGPALWSGLIGLGVTRLIFEGFGRIWPTGKDGKASTTRGSDSIQSIWEMVAPSLWFGLGTFVVVGSLFFLSPNGLSAALLAIPRYFRGWVTPSNVPALRLLQTLAIYQPMAVIFGLIALVRGLLRREVLSLRLGCWFVVTLLLALAYPERGPADLAWPLIPLWVLAAIEMARHFDKGETDVWEILGMFVLTVAILVFVGMDMTSMGRNNDPQMVSQRLIQLAGALGLLAASIVLVALGWSASVARLGSVCGAMLALGVYTFAMMWSAAGLRPERTFELWSGDPVVMQSDILLQTMNDLSDYDQGVIGSLPVAITGVDSPALRWLLRSWKISDGIDSADQTPLVIAADDPNATFSASYRGQDFTWRAYPGWDSMQAIDWVSWLSTRQVLYGEEKIILWARRDLFKDAQTSPAP
jgi:hypothetical protein